MSDIQPAAAKVEVSQVTPVPATDPSASARARSGLVQRIDTTGQLMTAAWRAIADAAASNTAEDRFDAANLAALRAAAAVLSTRATSKPGAQLAGGSARSVWVLLPQFAPELGEWADFFGLNFRVRTIRRGDQSIRIGERQADDLLRDAERFTHEVRGLLLRERALSSQARDRDDSAAQ